MRTPLSCRARLTEGAWDRPPVRIVISSCGRGVISVRERLVGVEMRKRRDGVRIVSKVGSREVCVTSTGGGTRKGDFGTGVETCSTGVVYGQGM